MKTVKDAIEKERRVYSTFVAKESLRKARFGRFGSTGVEIEPHNGFCTWFSINKPRKYLNLLKTPIYWNSIEQGEGLNIP